MSDISRATATPYDLRQQPRQDYTEGRRRSQRNDGDRNMDNTSLLPNDSASNFQSHQSGVQSASMSSVISTATSREEINDAVHDYMDELNERLMAVGMRIRRSEVRTLTDALFGVIGRIQDRNQTELQANDEANFSLRRQLHELESQLREAKTQLGQNVDRRQLHELESQLREANSQLGQTVEENQILIDTNQALSDYVRVLQGEVEQVKALGRELATSAEVETALRNKVQEQAIVIGCLRGECSRLQQRIDISTEDPDWVDVELEMSSLDTSAHIPSA